MVEVNKKDPSTLPFLFWGCWHFIVHLTVPTNYDSTGSTVRYDRISDPGGDFRKPRGCEHHAPNVGFLLDIFYAAEADDPAAPTPTLITNNPRTGK